MKRSLLAGILVLLIGGLFIYRGLQPPGPPKAAASQFVLSGVTVVNPGQGRSANKSVEVSADGVIRRISDAGVADAGALDAYRGAYLLPGLIDMHAHLPPANALQLTAYACLLDLSHGVTSLREAGDVDGTAVPAARKGVESGDFPGPRVFACGPFVSGAAGRWPNTIILGQPSTADEIVARIRDDGFNCIKAYDDLTLDQIRALKEASRKQGIPLIGHVPAKVAYEDAQLPDTQHLLGVPPPASLSRDHIFHRLADWQDVDEARMRRIVDVAVQNRLANTPTLVQSRQLALLGEYDRAINDPASRLMPRVFRDVLWNPVRGYPFYRNLSPQDFMRLDDAYQKKKKLVRMLYDAGATLHLGTDSLQPFVIPGVALQQEMGIFREIGIPETEIWDMATRRAGQALGNPMLGTIAEGAPADMLILRQDPTQSLEALDTLEAVIVQGRLYRMQDLRDALKRWDQHFDGVVFDRLSVAAAPLLMKFAVKRDY